ncbi:hypothetical protein A3K71_04285 [archaeon RBG_16_50_20]|nr:MAG: hypothetical protein A3K71_04285 [archaeon RBG_16_50_20]
MMTLHLEYFGLRVRELERSLKFYTELLGLTEVKRGTQYEIGGGIWVLLKDEKSNQHLELNWYPLDSPFNVEYLPGEGLDHIGFVVDNVVEKFEELVAKGAERTMIDPIKTKGWLAYLKDPDGNWIEIFQRTPPSMAQD